MSGPPAQVITSATLSRLYGTPVEVLQHRATAGWSSSASPRRRPTTATGTPAPAHGRRPAITGRIDEACGRPMDAVTFSWNLLADIQQMWSLPVHGQRLPGRHHRRRARRRVGWFMVLRRQTFAGHTLALVGFPARPAPCWLGLAR